MDYAEHNVYVGRKADGSETMFGEETLGWGLPQQGITLLATLSFARPVGAPMADFALFDVTKKEEWHNMCLTPEFIAKAKEALISWL